MDKVHCRTCKYLLKYNKTQGFNPVSKAGWCKRFSALRYAQVARNCVNYEIYNYFKDAPQSVCYNCENLKTGYKPPYGDKFNDEFRCQKYPFLFWYTDNLDGIHSITCNSYQESNTSTET